MFKSLSIIFLLQFTTRATKISMCNKCIDPLALDAEKRNHNPFDLRIFFGNNMWKPCTSFDVKPDVETSTNGCFEMKVTECPHIPPGHHAMIRGRVVDLRTFKGENFGDRWWSSHDVYTLRTRDGCRFEVTVCYRDICYDSTIQWTARRPEPSTTPPTGSSPELFPVNYFFSSLFIILPIFFIGVAFILWTRRRARKIGNGKRKEEIEMVADQSSEATV